MRKKSSNLKIVCATSAVLFSLFTCFTGVYAWFSNEAKNKTQSQQIKVKANPDLVDLSFSVYKYDQESKQGIKYSEDESGYINLSLNKFDNFIRERNINNNNVMRFELSFPNKYQEGINRDLIFSITCDTSTQGEIFDPGISDSKRRTHDDEKGYKYTTSGDEAGVHHICNNISNVLYFKVLPYTYKINGETYKFDPSINIDETNDSNTYFDSTNYFGTVEEKSCFVNSGDKEVQIDIDIDDIAGNADSIILYVEYNYDTTLIDEFLYKNEFKESTTTSEFFGANIDFFKDVLIFELTSKGDSNE